MAQKTLGGRIKEIRENAGLSQVNFGKSIGVSREVINALECNRFEPRIKIIRTIKNKYKRSYNWLLDGKK